MRKWTGADIPDQSGRTVLITGANSGLGLRSAEALASAGAHVLLGCRNQEKGAKALAEVRAVASGPDPELVALDLADLGSVRAAAERVNGSVAGLDVLMNNAGVMAIPEARTPDGFEMQFGTNHLGHFALTGLLLPALLRAPAPRVVTTSSAVHKIGRMRWNDLQWERRYSRWLAYAQSKLANLLFTAELDRWSRAEAPQLKAVAAHPGYAATNLQGVGPQLAGNRVMGGVMDALNSVVAQSDVMGAWPQLYAATMGDVESGEYFGPRSLFETRGHPTRVRPSRAARNQLSARRLWEISEQLTGVRFASLVRPSS
jgi:NAD(P)-dependent dehydrogenase (short-subunit alcohol dehydrogenase family)